MFLSLIRSCETWLSPSSSRHAPRSRARRLGCEALETRSLLSAFTFSTGSPDGKIAAASRPENGAAFEIESADDFVLSTETKIDSATFTGLIPTGATVNDVVVEIYRVFPKDSDIARTSGPPTFSTAKVPTRVNSPSDIALLVRDSTAGELTFSTTTLNPSFTAQNSVQPDGIHATPNQTTGGGGPVTGQEVQFNITFPAPFNLDLPADHYFFVPQVLTSTGDFLWLSAPKPIVSPPGTPFTPDLQSWTRDANLDPDWLRIGTDIVGGNPAPTFNAAFSLTGETFTPQITSLSQTSAVEGSSDLALTVSGSNFTSFSTILFNGRPLATTFDSASGQLKATVPAALLATEGSANVTVADAQRGLSNTVTFTITESIPTVTRATVSLNRRRRIATLFGTFSDGALEAHRLRISWGDGTTDELDLGTSRGGPFSKVHKYKGRQPRSRIVTVIALDDRGVASTPTMLTVRFRGR